MKPFARTTPAMRNVGAFTNTVKAQFMDAGGSDCFVPSWDKYAGAEQAMRRNSKRAVMGQKKSPIGKGTLTPSRK